MPEIEAAESARRIRAAIAYSDLADKAFAKKIGVSSGTLRNWVSRSRPADPGLDRRLKIAEAAGVPRSFMERGFADVPLDLTDRVAALERNNQHLATELRALHQQMLEREIEARGQRSRKRAGNNEEGKHAQGGQG